MHAFDVLAEPVRRRVVELLGEGELSSGEITKRIQDEFTITQPGVSQHLRVLRDNGFATVRAAGTRRLYSLDSGPLQDIDAWLTPYRQLWAQRLDAVDTEIRRGRTRRTT